MVFLFPRLNYSSTVQPRALVSSLLSICSLRGTERFHQHDRKTSPLGALINYGQISLISETLRANPMSERRCLLNLTTNESHDDFHKDELIVHPNLCHCRLEQVSEGCTDDGCRWTVVEAD